jgi:hypothetical protein
MTTVDWTTRVDVSSRFKFMAPAVLWRLKLMLFMRPWCHAKASTLSYWKGEIWTRSSCTDSSSAEPKQQGGSTGLGFLSLFLALQPFGSSRLFSFRILYTLGRTPRTGDQPVPRPLPAHRTTQHRIKTCRHPSSEWDSNPRSQCSSGHFDRQVGIRILQY